MATAEEIKARVRRADEARIEERAKLAADVAAANQRVEELQRELADAERSRADTVVAAERRMTPNELAGFLDRRPAVVREWKNASAPKRRRKKSGASKPTAGAQQSAADDAHAGNTTAG